ncbi:GAF domain-containing protein [uncultured Tateyamaria sp.]|uniref:GAF domain-containing protein n=1 Tax=uncultured Tateyamaria sp. TaxID=455651 RepID=UPI0026110BA5|nr:GAF domain-containing protein [uncultured Tateyamaria sp.]
MPDVLPLRTSHTLSEAVQLRAMRELLDIVSTSRDDEAPVFEAILKQACAMCNAPLAGLILGTPQDDTQTLAAHRGMFPEAIALFETGQMRMDANLSYAARSIIEGRLIALDDMGQSDLYAQGSPVVRSMVDASGIRSVIFVPLIHNGNAIGNLTVFRSEVRPFDAEEIALLEAFTTQAVIAIENARQFREVQTRLDRERASAEVLEAISQSRDNEGPVFDLILKRAAHLCDAQAAALALGEKGDSHQRLAASHGVDPRTIAVYDRGEVTMNPDISLAARAIVTGTPVHVDDMATTDGYRSGVGHFTTVVDDTGIRTNLFVPLMTENGGIGVMILFRKEVRPYTDDEIALVQSFAAQAVIAIDNVRQFREVQERLRRERASRDVLQIISTSRDDDGPVFQTILERASDLCKSPYAGLSLINDAGTHLVYTASHGPDLGHSKYGDMTWALDGKSSLAEAVRQGAPVKVDDMKDSDLYRTGDPQRVAHVDKDGIQSFLAVPLLQNGTVIGAFGLARFEVAPFSPDDVALVETFAAQAVIAIENVRQFREVQERLARETASREVLSVISQSRDDDLPVFDALLEKSVALSGSQHGSIWLVSEDGAWLDVAARREDGAEQGADFDRRAMDDSGSVMVQCVRDMKVRHIDDLLDIESFKNSDHPNRTWLDQSGARSVLMVPLVSEGQGIGVLGMYRRDVAPYSEEHVSLVQGYAAQAVIAIENMRQFREVRARLEREAATREILQVISQSPDDERPVFDAILSNASRLCNAPLAFLPMANAERTHVTVPAFRGVRPDFATALDEFREPMASSRLVAVRAVAEARVILSDDLVNDPQFPASGRWRYELVETEGARSVLLVPLMQGDIAIGAIMLYRREIAPFSPDDLELVRTFAAQAVIAIENVRQFRALETLNAELGERVDAQVGEIERMGKLKRFLPAAVADTVVSSGSEDMLKSHRALLGVLFCDIRGFTAFCETAEPEETIEVLQTYHQEMGKLINAHGAGVDHRMGDGIMVLFNDPVPCDDPAGDAVRLALAMRTRMQELCKDWKRLGHRLGFGVGVSLGYATVGMVGYEGRSDYTASGTAVNLAARLCDMAEDGQILLSPRAATAVEDDIDVALVGEVTLKGIRAPVEVFRLSD